MWCSRDSCRVFTVGPDYLGIAQDGEVGEDRREGGLHCGAVSREEFSGSVDSMSFWWQSKRVSYSQRGNKFGVNQRC